MARADRARRQRCPLDVGARAPDAKPRRPLSRKVLLRCRAWPTPWVHPGWMTQAASCAARPIPQPGASLRPASFPTACHSISSAEWGASRGTAGVRESKGPDQSRHERAATRGVRPERSGRTDAGQGRAVGAGCRLPARSRQPGAGSAAWRLNDHYPRFSAGRFLSAAPVSGVYDARELFAAVQVPLLHDRPWARDMALNIGLRWSDFSSFDQHMTWQAGLRWQPAEELTLRANYSEVFRAPSSH